VILPAGSLILLILPPVEVMVSARPVGSVMVVRSLPVYVNVVLLLFASVTLVNLPVLLNVWIRPLLRVRV